MEQDLLSVPKATSAASESKLGTRFLLFPQVPILSGYSKPEPVWISPSPNGILAGPEDHRMYVRDPLFPKDPYDYPYLPPFSGDIHAPALPGPDGHFDQITPESRAFLAAHAFGCVRRVLDIWESYLGHRIEWHFSDTYERLEIIPFLEWDNAQSGYGYLELGVDRRSDSHSVPYALNFDIIAHEIGHSILFSLFGFPQRSIQQLDFAPFHESSADLISLLSFLHFDTGMDRLLKHCQGNLLILNELNRIAELTGDRQIRVASNSRKLSEVTSEVHDRSRPFTGAVFDTLVEYYHTLLVQRGLTDDELTAYSIRDITADDLAQMSGILARRFVKHPFLFKTALTDARDKVAMTLAQSWPALDPDSLSFTNASEVILQGADSAVAGILEENFSWRQVL